VRRYAKRRKTAPKNKGELPEQVCKAFKIKKVIPEINIEFSKSNYC